MDQTKLAKMFGVAEIFAFDDLSQGYQAEASIIVDRISASTASPEKDYIYGLNKKGKLCVIPCHQHITKDFLVKK